MKQFRIDIVSHNGKTDRSFPFLLSATATMEDAHNVAEVLAYALAADRDIHTLELFQYNADPVVMDWQSLHKFYQ